MPDEPYNFLNLTDFTLGALTGNWAASLIPFVGKTLYEALQSKHGSIPPNHDMQRASRQAFANALLVLRDSLQRESLATNAEKDWLSAFGHWAGNLATSLDDGKTASPADLQHLAEFDKLLGSTPDLVATAIGKPDPIAGLRAHFHTTVLAWLTALVPTLPAPTVPRTVPACLAKFLTSGFSFTAPKPALWKRLFSTPPPTRPKATCLFDVWAQGYFENLKQGREAFRASVLSSAHDFGQSVAGLEEKLAEHADRAFACFTAFSGDFAEHARLTRAAFTDLAIANGILSTLVRGLDEKLDAIADQLQATHHLVNFAHGPKLRLTKLDRATDKDPNIADLHYTRRWMPKLLHREPEFAALHAFLYRTELFLWWGIIGEGGVGKSRIALDLITSAREAGWTAGFLDAQPGSTANPFPDRLDLWQPQGDTLVVIDYASFHRTDLLRALRYLAENNHLTGRLRVLLLDRPANLPAVFTSHFSAESTANETALRHCARPGNPRTTPLVESDDLICLQPLQPADHLAFLRAVIQNAGHANFTLDDSPDDLAKIARATGQGRPLLLTIYALSLIRPSTNATTRDTMDALLDDVLQNEIHLRWNRLLWGAIAQPEPHPLLPALQRAVAFITMCRGFSFWEKADLFSRVTGIEKVEDLEAINGALQHLLPYENNTCRPFEPDLLAERFLLNGGVIVCKPSAIKAPPKPFRIEDLIPLATTNAPDGMGELLMLILRDYGHAVIPLIAHTIPHIPPIGITAADGQLLPYEHVKNPIFFVWESAGLFTLEPPEIDIHGFTPALREWSQRSHAHSYASFIGVTRFCEFLYVEREHRKLELLAAFGTARSLLPPTGELCEPYAVLVAKTAYNAITIYGNTKMWEELEQWAGTLPDLATSFPDDAEIQTTLAKAAVNAIRAYGTAGKWEELEQWAGTLRGAMPEALSSREQAQAWQQIYTVLGNIQRAMPHDAIAAILAELEARFSPKSAPPEAREQLAALLQFAETCTSEELAALEAQLAEQGKSLAALRSIVGSAPT